MNLKNHKAEIAIVLALWLGAGFFLGSLNTAMERDAKEYRKNPAGGYDVIELNKTGCVYKSMASLLNIGYVAGCELFRKRFEIGK